MDHSLRHLLPLALAALLVFLLAARAEDVPDDCMARPPPPNQKPEMCCKIPEIIHKNDEEKKMNDTFHNCMDSLKSREDLMPEKAPGKEIMPPIKFMECIQECLYNSTGLLKDGKPEMEALKKLSMEYIGKDENWKKVGEEALKICAETSPKNIKPDAVCKSGAQQMTMCIMRELYLHCPASEWSDSAWCKEEKSRVEKCPQFMLPPPHHHMEPGKQ